MKIIFARQYRSREKATMTFVYALQGATPEQLAAYKKSKGDFFREQKETEGGIEKGTPLFFSTRYHGPVAKLMETSEKQWVVDSSEADRLINMTAQCDGNVELAKELIKMQNAGE
ncbi:MAG TPA: hypothetical protein VE933_04175 [Chitinophagaceae bacterium]|nr:hypothetical protein [Chitinophagaceae bacterium]